MVWRDFTLRYKQTFVGAGWAVLQPLGLTAVFAIFFRRVITLPVQGLPYAVFMLPAMVLWQFFSKSFSLAGVSLSTNYDTVTKVFFPRIYLPLAMIIGGLVDLAFALGATALVMLVYQRGPSGAIVLAPLFVLMAVLAAFGFGVWFAAFDARFRDLRLALPFVLQLWFFITPIVYSSVFIPYRFRWAYHLNPMAGAVEGFRWALLADVASPCDGRPSAVGSRRRRGDGERRLLLPARRRCDRRHPVGVAMGDVVITTEDLGKRYRARVTGRGRIRDAVSESLRARKRDENRASMVPFWALRHVDLEVMAGQVTGIIGRNGAGKSTLLKLLSRITTPTEGRAEIIGRVGSLLEVGTGFHIDLTGRENVFFSGAVLGMSRAEVRRKLDDIVAFAGVERFIDTPIKHYSSGMQVRLGFAIAAHLEPEVLIVDEVLAVGDEEFQRRCLEKIGDIAAKGLAILLVSHDLAAVRSRCDVAHLFDSGQLAASGPPQEIVDTYVAEVLDEGPSLVTASSWRLADGTATHSSRWPLVRS